MRQRKKTRRLALLLSMYGALLVFCAATDPRNLHPILLVLPVAWLFIALFGSFRFLSDIRGKSEVSTGNTSTNSRSLIVAGGLSGLLLLQSINQLTTKDIFLLFIFAGLTLLYAKRFKLIQKRD